MAPKTVLLLAPASFTPPAMYDIAVDKLKAQGYEVHVVNMPSVGRKEPTPNMNDDSSAIGAELDKLVEQGKDVLVISHSYSGIPVSEGVKGFGKETRAKKGKKGGVTRILYTTALVVKEGQSAADLLGQGPPAAFLKVDGDWMSLDPELHANVTFTDLPHEDGVAWTLKMEEHSAPSFATSLSYAGYKDIQVSYLLCERDKAVPPEIQQSIIDMIEAESGKKVDVHKVQADHCPWISTPDEVIRVIREITT